MSILKPTTYCILDAETLYIIAVCGSIDTTITKASDKLDFPEEEIREMIQNNMLLLYPITCKAVIYYLNSKQLNIDFEYSIVNNVVCIDGEFPQ
jgi:hypothetical protein